MGSRLLSVNTALPIEIQHHLERCSDEFVIPLTQRIGIRDYSLKIAEQAIRIEFWHESVLRGHVAAYQNLTNQSGFITNVSVESNYAGQGIATNLIADLIGHLQRNGIHRCDLEVHKESAAAIAVYQKFGFTESEDHSCRSMLRMTCLITSERN